MKKTIISPILVLAVTAVFAQVQPRLGILPFTGGSREDGDVIANLFANSRELRKEFSIILRTSSAEAIVTEHRFQRSGLTDSDTIAELGKQMNADYVVSGHIAPLGNANLLLISIVDVKTMQQVAGDYKEYGRIEDIPRLLPSMARRIIQLIRRRNTAPETALAVLPLNIAPNSAVKQDDAEILAQILATEIANSRQYAVFPRTKTIEAVMTEQDIQQSGMTDRESMIEIGKATNTRYVLAGAVSKLGSSNRFGAQILAIESNVLVEGASREYTNISDGIALMKDLAYEMTRKGQRQQTWDQFTANFVRFTRGDDGKRFTSLSANAGLGFGNETYLGTNGFANINIAVPLFWTLFAEGGMNIGFTGEIKRANDYPDENNEGEYFAYRPYIRLDIGYPIERRFFFLPYAGIGFGWTSAAYQFEIEESLIKKTITRAHEYTGLDLVLGVVAAWEHHGVRLGLSLNNVSSKDYFEMQLMLGYAYRF